MAFQPFDNDCGAHVAENESGNHDPGSSGGQLQISGLTIRHGLALPDEQIPGLLNAEGGGGAGYIHIEAESVDAQSILHSLPPWRVGALHIGGGNDNRIDISCRFTRLVHRFASRCHRHFTLYALRFIGRLGNVVV